MRYFVCCIFFLISIASHSQPDLKPSITFDVTQQNYGKIRFTNTLYSVFTFTNTGNSKLFILKVDADKKLKIRFPNVGIAAGDTGSIHVYYKPDHKGHFNEDVIVYTNSSDKAIIVKLSGNIESISTDPTECYSFSLNNKQQTPKPLHSGNVVNKLTHEPINRAVVQFYSNNVLVTSTHTLNGGYTLGLDPGLYSIISTAKDFDTVVMNEIYINKNTEPLYIELTPREPEKPIAIIPDVPGPVVKEETGKMDTLVDKPGLLSYHDYKANNIVFLIDVSTSMRSGDRLPLLKISIKKMIEQLREIDRVTIITYADYPKIIVPTTNANNKEYLYKMIDTLKAGGNTAGAQGLNIAYEVAEDHYLKNANNQIILATDGDFAIDLRDEIKIKMHASSNSKHVILTTVGFGRSHTSLERLQKLSEKGGGNYIYIANAQVAETAILDEIKNNSKKK